jgi:hypothetical protein
MTGMRPFGHFGDAEPISHQHRGIDEKMRNGRHRLALRVATNCYFAFSETVRDSGPLRLKLPVNRSPAEYRRREISPQSTERSRLD